MGVPIPPPGQICRSVRTSISTPALKLIQPGMTAGQYIEQLVKNKFFQDALRFMAYSMPIRYAIWWGCLCLEMVEGQLDDLEKEAVEACRNWVINPGEFERNGAERTAGLAPIDSAATVLARSASFVGVRLPQPKYGLPQNFPAKGVFSALWMATALGQDADQLTREFLKIGLKVSQGGAHWPTE